MRKGFSLFSAALMFAQAAVAAEGSKAGRDRQLSEIVFQNYPPRALAAGEEGPVFFTVTLDKDAHPVSCQVTHGSGHPLLDQETCDLIVQHAVFSQSRDANGYLLKTTEGVVNWTLPGHTPAPINLSPTVATAAKPEPQVCRKNIRVGSLAGFERTCMLQVRCCSATLNIDEWMQIYYGPVAFCSGVGSRDADHDEVEDPSSHSDSG